MAEDKKKPVPEPVLDDKDGKRGLFGGWNSWLNDTIQTGRAPEKKLQMPDAPTPVPAAPAADSSKARAAAAPGKMVIPEGVTIQGSLTGGPDTEIAGQIQGDVKVEGRLLLAPTARVTGKVQAGSCRIDGLVEGPVECTEEVELGKSGRLNSGVAAGKRISIAGQVYGSIATPGALRLAAGGVVNGDIRARGLVIEEGAVFNGGCSMRANAPKSNGK